MYNNQGTELERLVARLGPNMATPQKNGGMMRRLSDQELLILTPKK